MDAQDSDVAAQLSWGSPSWASRLLRSFRHHRRLIALCTIIATAIASVIAFQFPATYTAHARLKLYREVDRDMTGDALFVRLQVEVLQSQPLLRQVVGSLGTNIFSDAGETLTPDQAVSRLKEKLWVRRNAENNLVELYISSGEPQRAVEIANHTVDVYAATQQKQSADRDAARVRLLSNEMQAQEQRLAAAEARVQQLAGGEDPPNRVDSRNADLVALQQQLAGARSGSLEQRLRARSLHAMLDDDPQQIVLAFGDSTAQNLLDKLNDAEARASALGHEYGPGHSALQSAIAARDQCRVRLTEWIKALDEKATGDVARAEQRVAAIQREIDQKRQSLPHESTGAQQDLAVARADLTMEQDMVRLLRERVQSASLDLISGRSPIEVIEPASPGTVRMAMSWSRIVAMGILAGMLLGAVAGLALDQIRPRIDHVADVAKRLTVPVIGTISRRSRVLFGQDASEDELEHYRMLRNSIEFADEGFRSLCIAGAGSGEGRTLAALNLAWVWAEQGARVLLVDAHRRRPALHHQLGVVNNGGLSDCLTSRRSIDKFVQHTSMPNLSILTAGVGGVRGRPITPDLVDEIHEWARERVDLVIFDTPPLTRSSDAGVVARFSDAVVLVVRRDAHAAAVHQRAVSLLVASNCNVLGAIVNGSVGAQFELSHPGMRRSLPYRVVREQTLHDRVTRNSRKAA